MKTTRKRKPCVWAVVFMCVCAPGVSNANDAVIASDRYRSGPVAVHGQQDLRDAESGHWGGTGIIIALRDDQLVVKGAMKDTPGYRAGMVSGDRILEIDGRSTEGITLNEAIRAIRGTPGTDVRLKVVSSGNHEPRDISITREIISVPSVTDARYLEDGIAFIRVTQFGSQTLSELEKALGELAAEDLKGVVLDLRHNPGGSVQSAVDVAGLFIPRGELVGTAQGRTGGLARWHAHGSARYAGLPMAVLVNQGTAGSAELLAAALKHQVAILVGARTAGMGASQTTLPLEDGQVIRVTTAHLFAPDGAPIQDTGVAPDVPVELTNEDWSEIMRARTFRESTTAVDHQLEAALSALRLRLEPEKEGME